jgi:hypothetical protein
MLWLIPSPLKCHKPCFTNDKLKTAYNGRRHPIEVDFQWKKTSNGRKPLISKLKYFSNHR